jgi:uncharacterized Ntn-hydrolase superfamily protein
MHGKGNADANRLPAGLALSPTCMLGAVVIGTFPRIRRARRGTYSIVAREPETGAMGVAVQSHWFSVGPLVPWAEAGVGAVATQANIEVSYGPRLLDLLRSGRSAGAALAELVAEDPQAAVRQVAIVDARGGVATHTGADCMPFAGDTREDGFACQANLMASEHIWPAMAEAFRADSGSLPYRLLAALDAGEAAGGDVRGKQSAAILVVPARGRPWDRIVDLRVEDSPEPLRELRRLMNLHDAYVLAGEGDQLVAQGRLDEAAAKYVEANVIRPGNPELAFWAGLSLISTGDDEAGLHLLRSAMAVNRGWSELLTRLSPSSGPGVERARRLLNLTSVSES